MCRSCVVAVVTLVMGLSLGAEAPAQFGPSRSPSVPADQLVAESERFLWEARDELAGTRQGRNLEIRGNALLGAADAYREEARRRRPDEDRLLQALDGVERALAEVQRELNRPPGTAPRAAASARRIDRMVAELGGRADGGSGRPPTGRPPFPPSPGRPPFPAPPGRPPGGPPSAPGYDWRRVADLSGQTLAAIQALRDRIGREVGTYPPFDGVLRDLDGMASGLDRVNDLARRQVLASQLGPVLRPVRNQARRTGAVIQGSRPPRGIARNWADVERGIDELGRLLGLGAIPGTTRTSRSSSTPPATASSPGRASRARGAAGECSPPRPGPSPWSTRRSGRSTSTCSASARTCRSSPKAPSSTATPRSCATP
ncbi:hypothetical protein AB1L88_22185 [Tautonia sp. JC769]|uniref:hypothetical protein n=1 Tax=Tautonia sp. JC769 TaxID=3232135 RepID=UPI00345936BB